jgi:hypothetical protein
VPYFGAQLFAAGYHIIFRLKSYTLRRTLGDFPPRPIVLYDLSLKLLNRLRRYNPIQSTLPLNWDKECVSIFSERNNMRFKFRLRGNFR